MRLRLLLLPVLAYVALTVHASVAMASMTQPSTNVVSFLSIGEPEFQNQASSPLAPCCAERQCTKLVTAVPLIPTAGEQPRKPHHDVAGFIAWNQTPVVVATSSVPPPTRDMGSIRNIPVYLATARLRL